MLKRFTAAFIITTLAACGTAPERKAGEVTLAGSDDGKGDQQIPLIDKVDPATVRIDIVSQPTVRAASEGSTLKVPKVGITLNQADFVQVLRCRTGYTLRTPMGEVAKDLSPTDPSRTEKSRYAWANAFGSPLDCSLVGSQLAAEVITDLAAKTGDFYYVFNPCVIPERSKDSSLKGDKLCSYQLVFSQSLVYENNLSAEFLAKAEQLATAESKFAAHFSRLRFLASEMKMEQEACEARAAVDAARRRFTQGLVNLVGMGIQAATGAVISGPIAQILGVQSVLEAANKFLYGSRTTEYDVPDCPVVKEFENQFASTYAGTNEAINKVISIRNDLAKLHALYAKLDAKIESANNN